MPSVRGDRLKKKLDEQNLKIMQKYTNLMQFKRFLTPNFYFASGRSYLDTRNNVAHVGHAHPAVAAAVEET